MALDTDSTNLRLVGDDGTEHTLEGTQVVGRTDACDITIDSPRVSRQHATVTTADGTVTIEDKGSANGTSINGKQIHAPTVLQHGDRVCFEKHCFQFQGVATVMDDATVIAPPAGDGDATVISAAPDAPPAAAPPPTPPPAQESPVDDAALAALPGSWVDGGTGDQTRILNPGDVPEAAAETEHNMGRTVDGSHLLLKTADADMPSTLELTPGGGDEEDIWEIGRSSSCQVEIPDSAVSERHAQLVHRDGRWKIVNLVSTNGLFVNDERRLKAYLDDGDRIRLGTSTLVFFAAKGGAAAARKPTRSAGQGGTSSGSSGGKSPVMLIVAAVVVLAAAAGAWFFLA